MLKIIRRYKSYFLLLFFIVVLPLLLLGFNSVKQFFTRAKGVPANILVDTSLTIEPIQPVWNSFAQGGESSTDMIAPVVGEVKALHPKYIRIDHIYDHFNVVDRNSQGQLVFNFAELDGLVNSILKTGAIPFFSLSYMPRVVAENGDIIGKPNNWNDWALVVQKTIEHYSGEGFHLNDVYYEVWNEPDLFGKWKYYGDKNYLTLYSYAVRGAANAKNTKPFKIGGPALTAPYKTWFQAFADYVTKNQLRLDFISWHRYSKDSSQYSRDSQDVNSWLSSYPKISVLPRIVSEWGIDSENNPAYDSNIAAAHSVAVFKYALLGYQQLFAFELVDGLDPQNRTYWGRWGLITHPQVGKNIKPRYLAFGLLDQIRGNRLFIKGEGTYVMGIPAKELEVVRLLLTNYDPQNLNVEVVPITFTNLKSGTYTYQTQRLGQNPNKQSIQTTNNAFTTQAIMSQNSVMLLTLTPLATATPSASPF